MLILDAKRKSVGSPVEDLDVVVTTAGKVEKADGKWQQKLGITDTSSHIWAIASLPKNVPIIRGNSLLVKSAAIDMFKNKGGQEEKRLLISKFEIPTASEPPEEKPKAEGVLDPMIEKILEKYGIAATDALWPCTRTNKKTQVTTTNWIIYHRYCEQIAAKANIVFDKPELIVNDRERGVVVLLVTGRLGYVTEWSYGEASPETTFLPYVFAMAEKRAKDRVILKLAGFHGMVYSDSEENWKDNK